MSANDYSGYEVPLVPGTLRGYREWIQYGSTILEALHFRQSWAPGVNEAKCQAGGWALPPPVFHQAPNLACKCGFYAKHQPVFSPHMRGIPPPLWPGVIEASGRVIVGTNGFRAQKARIVAVLVPYELTSELVDNYPEVQWFFDREEMLKRYPPQDITSLIPAEELQRLQAEAEEEMAQARRQAWADYMERSREMVRRWSGSIDQTPNYEAMRIMREAEFRLPRRYKS